MLGQYGSLSEISSPEETSSPTGIASTWIVGDLSFLSQIGLVDFLFGNELVAVLSVTKTTKNTDLSLKGKKSSEVMDLNSTPAHSVLI